MRLKRNTTRHGFTIVELLVVIVVIGILATISIVSYGAWKTSAAVAQVKSDLNGVASAMESARTFANAYPTTLPTSFTASNGVVLAMSAGSGGTTYCVDGSNSSQATVHYYIASESKDQGPLSGTCATRPGLPVPNTPTNLAMTSVSGTHVTLSWTAATNAATYTAQCASDAGFILGLQTTTVTVPTVSVTINGLTPSSVYYCRVDAVNANGASGWVSQNSGTNTTNNYGALAVATSIDGYWTSAPQGFLLEDGSAVSRTTYSDLFNVIGTTYGAGDGLTTFNLPDSRGRVSVNLNAADAEFNTVGEKYGTKTEQLSIAEMPSHTHIQNPHDHNGGLAHPYVTTGAFGGAAVTSANGSAFGYMYGPAPAVTATNQYTGGNVAHNIIQPSIVMTSAIKYTPIDTSSVSYPAATSIQGYWSSAPTEYLLEDGSAVSRTTYATLFAAIGTTYGAGDGSTTFNLPDSRGRVAVNLSPTDSQFNTMGEKYGEKTHLLTILEMASHTHIQNPHDHNGGFAHPYVTDGSWGLAATTTQNGSYYGFMLSQAPATTATNQYTGGGTAHNVIQPSITKQMAIKYTASTGTINPVVPGTSVTGYWSSAPAGYLAQDGSAVSRSTYAALFTTIGTTYGSGDGSTTFNLPDSRGRVAVNLNPSDAEFNTMGEKYGEKTHVLSIAELPSHTHIQNPHDHNGGAPYAYVNDNSFGGLAAPAAAGTAFGFTLARAPSATATNQNTGGGQAFNVIQPSIVKMFAIKY